MQNSGRFRTTSDFDREYVRKVSRYRKSDRQWSTAIPPAFSEKKSGKLWSTNYKVGDVSLDPLKSTSSEDHISAPKGPL